MNVDALKRNKGACPKFKMWGKESANRDDKKYGLWVPPCEEEKTDRWSTPPSTATGQGGGSSNKLLQLKLLLQQRKKHSPKTRTLRYKLRDLAHTLLYSRTRALLSTVEL
jgi:hypothetical protein